LRARVASQTAKLEGVLRSGAAPNEAVGFGDIRVEATWEGAAGCDLDIVVVDPNGTRLAWSARAKGVRVADPTSRVHEALAVSTGAAGPFGIELVRADASNIPVRGTLTVRSVGSTMTRPFVLTASRLQVARATVTWDSRLVPMDTRPSCDPPFFFDAAGRKRTKPECL
jgi:hypothetical protein